MTAWNYRSFVYGVVFMILCMGCENPTETVERPGSVNLRSQFVIENNGSTAKTISLKKAYRYDDVWEVRSEAGREDNSPVSIEVPPGEEGAMETRASMRADSKHTTVLSFVLAIDDKRYVGWADTAGDGGLEEIAEYGLGYITIIPGKINPYAPEVVLTTTLTPKVVESRLDKSSVTALYGVKITDEGVAFTLYK
ncbi:MAG: hypothetical protein LBU16_06960 [Treponema sp.]|jgi:hypothetical protein|nr:hypothetical protein [Treponema sp.]